MTDIDQLALGEKLGELTGAVHSVGEKVDGLRAAVSVCQAEHGARLLALEKRPVYQNGSKVWKLPILGSVPVSAAIAGMVLGTILIIVCVRQEGIASTVNGIKELRTPRTTERIDTTYTSETKTGGQN